MTLLRLFTAVCAVCAVACATATAQGIQSSEMVHINGKKNPEMIPQWTAWDTLFRAFKGPAEDLPTDLYRALTPEEMTMLVEAVKQFHDRVDPCMYAAIKELRSMPPEAKMEEKNNRMMDLNIGCRRKTLTVRDELLEKLRPESRAALNQWVEVHIKPSISVSVPKHELAFFKKPE